MKDGSSESLDWNPKWARKTLGLDFTRLREDGVILTGLRTALEEAVKAGEVIRRRGGVSPAPSAQRAGRL